MSKKRRQKRTVYPREIQSLKKIMESHFKNQQSDLVFSIYNHNGKDIAVFYIPYLVHTDKKEKFLLEPLLKKQSAWTGERLINEIPLSNGTITNSIEESLNKLILGEVIVYIEAESNAVCYPLAQTKKRSLEKPEIESVILGPQIAFTESISTNLNLIRQGIQSTDLVFEKIMIGSENPREVRIVYLKSFTNETDVKTIRQRLEDLIIDEVEDITILKQYIEDSSTNLFPQFYTTELPDRLSYVVQKGKIGVLMENSPEAIIAPSTFFSFLESSEDLYMRWNIGSVLRLLRFLAMFISISVTPIYVAIITYQYELIPSQLLITIGQSRATVPYPPIIEALIIEFLVELLREAGARLPTKIGQTIGIVGGIIIGESAVQAGLTSNILIIVVALSALASYSTPNYLMATTLRLIRIPMILLAALYGIIGIMFGFCFIIIHLLKLTSLDRPYLAPLYPLNIKDFNKVFFHLPRQFQNKHARLAQSKKLIRYPRKSDSENKDIDE